ASDDGPHRRTGGYRQCGSVPGFTRVRLDYRAGADDRRWPDGLHWTRLDQAFLSTSANNSSHPKTVSKLVLQFSVCGANLSHGEETRKCLPTASCRAALPACGFWT